MLTVVVANYILFETARRLGIVAMKKLFGDEDVVRAKLVREGATVPVRGTEGAAGWDVHVV